MNKTIKKQDSVLAQETTTKNIPDILIDRIVISKKLSLRGKKIFVILISMILDLNEEEFKKGVIYTSLSELAKEMNITSITDIEKTLIELREYSIKFDTKKEIGNVGLTAGHFIKKSNQDSLRVKFDTDLLNVILEEIQEKRKNNEDCKGAKKNKYYTKLEINELNKLKFSHSFSLYQIFKCKLANHKTQPQNYTETDLRKRLGLLDTYKEFKTFNFNAITKSIKDINENTSLKIELLKIEKPTKSNDLTERVYKFRISQNIEKSTSREDFSDFLKSSMKDPKYQYRSHTYTLEVQSVFEAIEGKNTKLWTTKNGNTVSKDTSINIWDSIWKEFSKDQLGTLEKLGYDVEDFIDFLMNKRRKK